MVQLVGMGGIPPGTEGGGFEASVGGEHVSAVRLTSKFYSMEAPLPGILPESGQWQDWHTGGAVTIKN